MTERQDFKRWSPELRRAVMKVRPEFFSWSREQRERYAVSPRDEEDDLIDQALLAEVFGESLSTLEQVRRAVRDMPMHHLHQWNAPRLPFFGIGEDCFFFNGFTADRKTLLDFANLREYDEAQHHYQERARHREFTGYEIKPYLGQLYLNQAWLYVDERFTYGSLSMAAGYIYAELESITYDLVQECIPWKYVNEGSRSLPNDDGRGYILDTRRDAGGQEAILDELEDAARRYTLERFDALKAHWHNSGKRAAYIFEDECEFSIGGDDLAFVFSDTQALEAVRFPSFVRDCRAIERPAQELFDAVAAEREGMRAWVHAKHQELLQTFDPKVAKLRRRPQVGLTPEAVDDVQRIADEGASVSEKSHPND
jgi:hypothetical protein